MTTPLDIYSFFLCSPEHPKCIPNTSKRNAWHFHIVKRAATKKGSIRLSVRDGDLRWKKFKADYREKKKNEIYGFSRSAYTIASFRKTNSLFLTLFKETEEKYSRPIICYFVSCHFYANIMKDRREERKFFFFSFL